MAHDLSKTCIESMKSLKDDSSVQISGSTQRRDIEGQAKIWLRYSFFFPIWALKQATNGIVETGELTRVNPWKSNTLFKALVLASHLKGLTGWKFHGGSRSMEQFSWFELETCGFRLKMGCNMIGSWHDTPAIDSGRRIKRRDGSSDKPQESRSISRSHIRDSLK